MLFISLLTLVDTSARRSLFGLLLTLISGVTYREVAPFKNPSTNVLNNISQCQLFLTFLMALLLNTDMLEGYSSLMLGTILLVANLWGLAFRWVREPKATEKIAIDSQVQLQLVARAEHPLSCSFAQWAFLFWIVADSL